MYVLLAVHWLAAAKSKFTVNLNDIVSYQCVNMWLLLYLRVRQQTMFTFLPSCSSEEASFMKNGVEDMSTGVLMVLPSLFW